jgi:hypothetical protein
LRDSAKKENAHKAFVESFKCCYCGMGWNKDRAVNVTAKFCSEKCTRAARRKQKWSDPIKREKILAWNRAYDKRLTPEKRAARYAKKKQNPQFIIVKAHRRRIWEMCARGMMIKKTSSLGLIGCSVEFLKSYIEQRFTVGMSWDNYGRWHVDHVIPLASFDLTKISEQRKAFHYSNMQPLWKDDNLSKSDRVLCQSPLPLSA